MELLVKYNCSKDALTAAILYNSLDYSCRILTLPVNDEENKYLSLSNINEHDDKEFILSYKKVEKEEPL